MVNLIHYSIVKSEADALVVLSCGCGLSILTQQQRSLLVDEAFPLRAFIFSSLSLYFTCSDRILLPFVEFPSFFQKGDRRIK